VSSSDWSKMSPWCLRPAVLRHLLCCLLIFHLTNLTFIGPCIVILFLWYNQLDAPMYQIYFILKRRSTCFGRSFRPSSGVQDCIYSNRHLSNRYCCLLASAYQVASRQPYLFDSCMYSFELLMMDGKTVRTLASRQQYLFDKCLLLYVQSWTADDGRNDRPKHVVCYSKIKINLIHWCIYLVLL